ncbi:MAG: FlgD immunoglobulin-like domain containing protein, partial [Calditrichota bacterium]
PGNFYAFSTGADNQAPVVSHNPLGDQALAGWPAIVSAEITDNLSVEEAVVTYSVNGGNTSQFSLSNTSGDIWSAAFPIDPSTLSEGDMIAYNILATDGSSSGNQTFDPPSGNHTFEIVASRGLILVIDDDPSSQPLRVTSEKGTYERNLNKSPFGLAAGRISNQLNGLGFTSVVEAVANTDPNTWDSYSLIISSSGINVNPVADANYRAALENWVNSDPSNKLLVEGGEVGYDAVSSPAYPSFAADVIHSDSWATDDAGAFNLISSQSNHPMVTTPNQLPNSFPIDYSDWPSEDAVSQIGGAYILYEPSSEPGNAGIAIYDDNTNQTSAQIVYIAANYAEFSDTSDARMLLENAVQYLLTSEVPTGIGDDNTSAAPQAFALNANYPNPFNPTTTISYDVREASDVRVSVFNMLGQEVRTLVSGKQAAGTHEVVWDATNNLGEAVSSGIYLYQLQAGDFVQTRKMILLK